MKESSFRRIRRICMTMLGEYSALKCLFRDATVTSMRKHHK